MEKSHSTTLNTSLSATSQMNETQHGRRAKIYTLKSLEHSGAFTRRQNEIKHRTEKLTMLKLERDARNFVSSKFQK